MKKQNVLLVMVTLIDLITVWPFQGAAMRVVDVVLGLGLLATLRARPAAPPGIEAFGVGERVQLVRNFPPDVEPHARINEVYGQVLGAATTPGLLRVQLDVYRGERELTPDSLSKVSLFDSRRTDAAYVKHYASS